MVTFLLIMLFHARSIQGVWWPRDLRSERYSGSVTDGAHKDPRSVRWVTLAQHRSSYVERVLLLRSNFATWKGDAHERNLAD
jgi:hypothetical protein